MNKIEPVLIEKYNDSLGHIFEIKVDGIEENEYIINHENIDFKAIGLFSALFQRLSTILTRYENVKIKYVTRKGIFDIVREPDEYPILCFLLFFETTWKVYLNEVRVDDNEALKGKIIQFYTDLAYKISQDDFKAFDNFRLKQLFIPCIDTQERFGRNPLLYNTKSFKEITDIRPIVDTFLKGNKIKLVGDKSADLELDIASIIRELYHNSEEWGRTDFEKFPIKKSVRIFNFKFFDEHEIDNMVPKSFGYVGSYFYNMFKAKERGNYSIFYFPGAQTAISSVHKLGIIELSIVDCGLGLATRFSGKSLKDLKKDEELSLIKKCFKKNYTASISDNSDLRGIGLYNVIKTIGKTGLLILGSGRYLLTRDFLENNLKEDELVSENLDFVNEDTSAKIGTSITILIPFFYSKIS